MMFKCLHLEAQRTHTAVRWPTLEFVVYLPLNHTLSLTNSRVEGSVTILLNPFHTPRGCLLAQLYASTIKGKKDLGDTLKASDAHQYYDILSCESDRLPNIRRAHLMRQMTKPLASCAALSWG